MFCKEGADWSMFIFREISVETREIYITNDREFLTLYPWYTWFIYLTTILISEADTNHATDQQSRRWVGFAVLHHSEEG